MIPPHLSKNSCSLKRCWRWISCKTKLKVRSSRFVVCCGPRQRNLLCFSVWHFQFSVHLYSILAKKKSQIMTCKSRLSSAKVSHGARWTSAKTQSEKSLMQSRETAKDHEDHTSKLGRVERFKTCVYGLFLMYVGITKRFRILYWLNYYLHSIVYLFPLPFYSLRLFV